MSFIFDLPHIFIVFPAGAGGNFLSGIYNGLINKEYSNIAISESGSSHTTLSKKFIADSDLSMGTFMDTTENVDEKIKYYRESFSKFKITRPLVSWTHNFKNISLYQNIFSNSKIIVITQTTDAEQLAVTFMHVIKNLLDTTVVTPIPANYLKFIQKSYMQACINILRKRLPKHQVDEIVSNPVYRDIITFIHLTIFLDFYGLRHLVENVPKQYIEEIKPINMYSLTNKPYDINKYLTNECVLLPYSYIMSGDVTVLLNVIRNTLSRELTAEEKMFVEINFNKYRDKQNLSVLTDPITYYEQLKQNMYQLLKNNFT